jgi:hypothetical protein
MDSPYRQRILGAYIDVALIGTYGISSNSQPFDHSVRICFQDRAVHESTRIPFIGVADYIFLLPWRIAAELPLAAGGKTGTAPPSQTGIRDLTDDLLRCHFKDGLPQRPITPAGSIVVDFFRVDLPTVAQDDALLFLVEVYLRIARYGFAGHRVTVKQAFYWLAISEMRDDNLGGILGLNMGVENALWFNDHIWTLLTEAVATGEVDLYIIHPFTGYFVLECLIDSFRPAGNAACSLTDKDGAVVLHAILHPSDS